MPRTVPAIGPTDRPILALVGEAPGREEERIGKPFVGASGFELDRMLAAAGVSRFECYITNVVNYRPPNNNFRTFYLDSKLTKPTPELLAHRARLRNELLAIRPKVVVALGDEPLKALAGVKGISTWRGTMIEPREIVEFRGVPIPWEGPGSPFRIMPTFHPAYVLRKYNQRPIVELDLKKALRQTHHPTFPDVSFHIQPVFEQVRSFLLNERPTPVTVDIETLGHCTRSIGFGWSERAAISIPIIWRGTHYWLPDEEAEILQLLKNYLGDPSIEKYLQNAPFDTTILENDLGLFIDGITLDTMYAHHLLYPEFPKGLDFLSSVYTDFPMYWGGQQHVSDEANAKYGCYDCCATFAAAKHIINELHERELWDFYNQRIHPLIFAITRVQNRGIRVDEANRNLVRDDTEKKLNEAKAKIAQIVGYELNPNSSKKVMELIYDTYKLPVQKHPTTKKRTSNDDALRSLARKFPERAPVLRAILEARQCRTLISNFIDTKLDHGRARTSYGLASSGRLTSSETWDGYGSNLQNIPRTSFRRLYTADPGKVLIISDLKQAEYMVFCWDAPVPEFIQLYITDPKFDVHLLNSTRVYEIPASKVTPKQRYDVKQGVYAGNYQIGALKLSKMYDMEFHTAKRILERYIASRPELPRWWTNIEHSINTTRKLRNPLGRERIFFGRRDKELLRKACNWLPQSTVADIINQAVVTLDDDTSGLVEVLLQVHDELVCQCPEDRASVEKAVALVRKAMEVPIKFPKVDIPLVIPVEIKLGRNWHDVVSFEEYFRDVA